MGGNTSLSQSISLLFKSMPNFYKPPTLQYTGPPYFYFSEVPLPFEMLFSRPVGLNQQMHPIISTLSGSKIHSPSNLQPNVNIALFECFKHTLIMQDNLVSVNWEILLFTLNIHRTFAEYVNETCCN